MRTRLIPVLAALAMVLLLPASATAAPPEKGYHGVFTSAAMVGCTGISPSGPVNVPFDAMGEWNVTIDGAEADVSATIYANFNDGYGWFLVDSFSGDQLGVWQVLRHGHNFWLQIAEDNYSGSQVDFMLTGNRLEFRITPYVIPGFWNCQYGVTYGTWMN